MPQYYVKRSDKVHGPFTSQQIKSGLKSGRLNGNDLISDSSGGPFQELKAVLGFEDGSSEVTAKSGNTLQETASVRKDTYFIQRRGKVFGPVSLKALQGLLKSNTVSTSDLISSVRAGPFQDLGVFLASYNEHLSGVDPAPEGGEAEGEAASEPAPSFMPATYNDGTTVGTAIDNEITVNPSLQPDINRAPTADPSPLAAQSLDAGAREAANQPPPGGTKTCPFCAEIIASAAIKCKHCGELLNQSPTQFSSPKEGQPLELTQESEFVFLLRGGYPLVYALAKHSLEKCGGTIKKDELSSGLVEGGWRYGLNPFLRVRWTLEDAGNGCVRSTAYGYYSDGTLNRSKAIEKAQLVVKSFQELAPTAHEAISVPQGGIASNAPVSSSTKEGGGGLARASFICALLSVICFGCIFGPMAIVLGIAAIMAGCPDTQIARAWTGIIVGIAGLVLHAILFLVYMAMF
ncbi:MAG: hypothetical protein ACR2NF_05905 [Pirellulales bacterium]|jgi:hypothetical protein